MADDEMRIKIKRSTKKKSGYAVEKRSDGFYYLTAVPSKKSSIQPGDRVLEINGVKHKDFKSAKAATDLFDLLVLDTKEEEDDEDSEDSET